MTEARHLTKRYGHTVAVVDASFAVRPGRVTGCLGPERAWRPPRSPDRGRHASSCSSWPAPRRPQGGLLRPDPRLNRLPPRQLAGATTGL